MYRLVVRPLFFRLSPEAAHHIVVGAVKVIAAVPGLNRLFRRLFRVSDLKLTRKVWGITFDNPVGLAAGFDKNADFYEQFGSFGFAFIEVGTVTPKPQPGNPKPRLFRLIPDKALVNRMGFNNKGVNYVKSVLARRKPHSRLVVGGNIGKNTLTPNENAIDDYITCFNALYDYVDYLVVNVSCPNVTNLGALQHDDSLRELLSALMEQRMHRAIRKPVLLKLSPDLNLEQLESSVRIAEKCGIDGYIASNTTTSRENLQSSPDLIRITGNGGLSGKPLRDRATEMIAQIHKLTRGEKPIIGVGGIFTPEDAIRKLEAGATLLQVYTGFIYEGPFIVKRINKQLIRYYSDRMNR